MRHGIVSGETLISRPGMAGLAGVGRSAITNWERRHPDFPKPIVHGETEHFRLGEFLAWLDTRPVPSRARQSGEQAGLTYGDRARKNLSESTTPVGDGHLPDGSGRPANDGDSEGVEAAVAALIDVVTTKWRPGRSSDGVVLLACLIFLRNAEPGRWATLREPVAADGAVPPSGLLDRVGRMTDQVLLAYGIAPRMRTILNTLRPSADVDPRGLLAAIEGLGRAAFRVLLVRYAEASGLDSREAPTPADLATLVGELFGPDAPRVVHDPHARGGELPAAVLEAMPERPAGCVVRVGGPRNDLYHLRVMFLLLHGVPLEPETSGSTAPWCLAPPPPADVDLVVVNPPFNAASDPLRATAWPYGPPPPHNDNLAWGQYAPSMLRPTGRAAVFLPNNAAVSTHQKEVDIRRAMVEAGVVECVVALPPNMFATTPIPVSVWILRKSADAPGEVLFIDARSCGSIPSRQAASRRQRRLSAEERAAIVTAYRSWRQTAGTSAPRTDPAGLSAAVPTVRIRDNGYSLNPADYVDRPRDPGAVSADPVFARDELLRHCADASRLDAATRPMITSLLRCVDTAPPTWERRFLRELCEIQPGPSAALLNKGTDSPAGGVPVVQPKHLRDRRVLPDVDSKVDRAMAARLEPRYAVAAGDILCARTGTMGPAALVDFSQHGWLMGTNLLRLRVFAGVDPGFLLAYLSLPGTLDWIRMRAESTAVPSISRAVIGELPVALPEVRQQQEIGDALAALDEQIAAHRDAAEAGRVMHRALAERLIRP